MDKKYLKQRRRGWYVRVRVPKSLEQVIGKSEIIRTLHTRSIDEARSLRWAAIKEIKEYLDSLKEAQEKGGWNSPQDIVQGARLSLGAIQTGQRSRKEEVSHFDAALNAFEEDHFPDDPETQEPSTPEEYRPAISLAHSIIGGTSGKMVGECLMDHLAEIEKRVRLQTVNARKRRINVFIHWLKYDREISAVTRSEAGEYVTVLMKQDRSLKTIKDTVSDLSAFFNRCQPWRAKRRLVIPGSREAALLTRRARSAPEGKQSRHPNTASSHW
ncbi:MAG: phage integrase N-terminal SAM-like domain-containing protein, partial [Candidatus Sedimenticola sp. (ex Thyasira tokunagai)]